MSNVFKNIFWLTFSRAIALGLLLLAYSQLFRYLGPFGSGQYQFVLSYVLIFSTVVDFGVQQFITKKMSEDPGKIKKYFRDFLNFEVFAAVALYILLIAIAYFRHYDPVVFKAVAVTGLGMVANALTYPFLAVMTAKQDLKKVALINFLNSLVNISIIFLAIWLKKYIVFLASVQLVFGVLDLVLYRIFVRKYLGITTPSRLRRDTPPFVKGGEAPQSPKDNPGALLLLQEGGVPAEGWGGGSVFQIFKHAWPFALLVGFSAIYNRIDVIIITKLLGYEQTGFYTAAYKFLDILNFFPASVSHVLFPVLAGFMAKNLLTDVKLTLEKYSRLMLAVALPLAVGGMVLSKALMIFIAGSKFESSAPILSILIWAAAILFVYIPVNSLIISQLTKKAALVTGANVLVNILGNILLIPHYGIKAAAVMTVVSESLQGIFYFYFVRKNITNFDFFKNVWQPAIAAVVMGAALYFIRDRNLIITLVSGGLIYFLMLLTLGFIKKSDITLVKTMLGLKANS